MERILLLSNKFSYDGASKNIRFLSDTFKEAGYIVKIAALDSTGFFQDENEARYDVSIVKSSYKKFIKRLIQIKDIGRIIKENKIQLIISFTSMPNVYASLMKTLYRIPTIMSERSDPYSEFHNDIITKLMICIINHNSGGVFQTEGAKHFYSKKMQKRSVVIPNPVFLPNNFSPENKNLQKSFVALGRLDNKQKRYDVLIEAFMPTKNEE